MVIRGENGTKTELFGLFDSSTPIPRASQWGSTLSHAGERVSLQAAAGLPAFLRGLRLIAETAAGLDIKVSREQGGECVPQPNSPQAKLLDRPNPDLPSFDVWAFLFTQMVGRGNSYLYKIKDSRGKVIALYPIPAQRVTPKYEGASAIFEIKDGEYGRVTERVGRDRIIHFRGILLDDPYIGVSVVEAHRNGIGNELARQRFEGRYIQNDTAVGMLLKHPGNVTEQQRGEIRASFEARHAGADRAGRPAVLWGGWDAQQMSVSLNDAQFIESKRYSVGDIARMLGVPASMLGEADYSRQDAPEIENMRLLQLGVRPWMERLEQGLENDADLFPQPDWEVEFDEQGFLRADIKTRFEAYRLARQGGWITGNEIRQLEGYQPVEGGDQIQETPVGGAANQSSNTGMSDGSSD